MTDQLPSGTAGKVIFSTEDKSYRDQVLEDYRICCLSREASILGRKEVLSGKAKFGILGDGKEVPQVAMARAFQKGDWRSGYYRDQTFMFALGLATVEEFFAQIYADADNDPWSGGRQMNSHFASPLFDEDGEWLDHTNLHNISSDISCTGGQMARAVGLALSSKIYRELPQLDKDARFSRNGEEICFATIGDASTSEGVFWETVNAAGVLQIPLLIAVWDDGYGISVPTQVQTTKGSISQVLEGFKVNDKGEGIDIYVEKCWNYQQLCDLFQQAADKTRATHTPALVHVEGCTQQLGHSTSGSHERYKTPERLQWERDNDCIVIMADWIVRSGIASREELEQIQDWARSHVREQKDNAWKARSAPIQKELNRLDGICTELLRSLPGSEPVSKLHQQLKGLYQPAISDLCRIARRLLFAVGKEPLPATAELRDMLEGLKQAANEKYHTHLHSSGKYAALNVPAIPPVYSDKSENKNGYEILNAFFDKALAKFPNLLAFGEDLGKIGGVNQSFMGMQEKYGVERVFDTGIREWTIIGQAIGMAMRGLRPIAEIQYLDYLVYALEPLTDDLATLRYRSDNLQRSPAIIRTRGHRLEGIWHSGSPIGMILHSLRGIYVLVPRNFVQAAGFYNTMLHSDDPALIIECLNGYRLKERLPDNIGEYTLPLGVPEILHEGTDLSLVTYGSCVRVAEEAISLLSDAGISVELIDVQTLLPFDLEHSILASLKKTNRILFLDEDVPGGATAFMMQEVLEKQGGYSFLDAPPATLTAKPHRTPYGSDGDYFSKPNVEDVYEAVFRLVREHA